MAPAPRDYRSQRVEVPADERGGQLSEPCEFRNYFQPQLMHATLLLPEKIDKDRTTWREYTNRAAKM